jgi:hypothetical protein
MFDGTGSPALGSEEVNVVVPVYPVATFPARSYAVRVKLKPTPETAVTGTETPNRTAAPGSTLMLMFPVIDGFVVSLAVTV